MAVARCPFFAMAIAVSIGMSSTVFAWNPDARRFESYDLERGPVFYEAYYPDNADGPRDNYQEKRYLDRSPVLEKTYQLPSGRVAYPENTVQPEMKRDQPFHSVDRFTVRTGDDEALDIEEISRLARRAISRDLENWNAIENYLDRAEPLHRRRIFAADPRYRIEERSPRIQENYYPRPATRDLYEEVRDDRDARGRVPLPRVQDPRVPSGTGGSFVGEDLDGAETSLRYAADSMRGNEASSKDETPVADPYPTENIFEPRPQVINYIFSRRPETGGEKRVPSPDQAADAGNESAARNYGDNLIEDETKKSVKNRDKDNGMDKDKDVKVTSIEVQEMPRHRTRHHHGDWPKRDYPRHH